MSNALVGSVQAQIARAQAALNTDAIPWLPLIQTLLLAVLAFEVVVSLRQLRTYSRSAPPAALKPHVEQATYEKSREYGRDKLRFSIVSMVYEWALSAALLHVGAFARIWTAAGTLMPRVGLKDDSEVWRSLIFLLISQPITSVPTLPLSLYRHFVIEERHGFNKMTLATYFVDGIKEFAVGVAIMGPLMGGLIKLIRWAGDAFVAYVVVFLFAFQICAMVLYPTLIQPLFNKLTPLQDGPLKERVVALASQLNFPLKSIYVIDGSKRSAHSNAYFYGVLPGGSKHIVIYDTLIEKSTPDEIEAVLAHELGHWAHSDPAKLLGLSQVQIAVTMVLFSLFIHNASLFRAFGFEQTGAVGSSVQQAKATMNRFLPSLVWASPPSALRSLFSARQVPVTVHATYLPLVVGLDLFQLVLHPLGSLVKFGVNAAVRRMEYAADTFAARQPRAPGAGPATTKADTTDGAAPSQSAEPYHTLLGKALIKLHVQNLSTMHHDALYSAYHYSHPTLAERLDALDHLAASANAKGK